MDYSILKDKSIIFFGDSITAGADYNNNRPWPVRVAEITGAKVKNAGVGGASAAYIEGRPHFVIDQLHENKAGVYDYVILHAGVNDMGRAPIGIMCDSYNPDDFDTNTFAGGLENIFYHAYKYFPNAKIGYIINYQVGNDILGEIFKEAKKICEKWNMPYLDLYDGTVVENGVTKSISIDILDIPSRRYFAFPEMLTDVHFSEEGYNLLSPYIAEWIPTLTKNINPIK